jgi:acyl-CoA synthetase (AMP-forming)/AMP-acid ligase II
MIGESTVLLMGEGLRRNAFRLPRKIAARDRFRAITYDELNRRVNQLAHGLLSLGVCKGDAVALSVGNRIEHLEIIFATAKLGALAIPLDVKWKALELSSVLSFFKPKLLILQQECVKEFRNAARAQDLGFVTPVVISDLTYSGLLSGRSEEEPGIEVSENDPFAVLLTSGTTGFPKGCLSTHRAFAFVCIGNAIEKGLGVHDTAILASPLYFNVGRSFTLSIIFFGGTIILHEHFDAEAILKTIEQERVTYIGAVPAMCERLLHVLETKQYDTSSLRCLLITGGKLHAAVLEKVEKKLTPNIYRSYGATDTGQMATSRPGEMKDKPEAVGRPVWFVDLRIVDDRNHPVKPNEIGEIICRSPIMAQGYYKNVEATEAAFRDGWFHTGDLGYFDDDCCLYVVGRKKDMVKSGGISIYPQEIESVIYRHPDVLEAAVVGMPDVQWGEAVTAVVVLRPGTHLAPEQLMAFCKERLSNYKVPKSVEVRSTLPHTESGKVNKVKLRELLLQEGRTPS